MRKRFYGHTQMVLILLCVILTYCSKPVILGEWKPRQIIIRTIDHNEVVLDLSDPVNLRKEFFRNVSANNFENGVDSQFLMSIIEQKVKEYQNASLTLKTSKKVTMKNFNLLLSTAIPGWHISDTIIGEWALTDDTLLLSAGPDGAKLNWKFQILNLSSENLRIKEIEGASRKEIVFTKD